MPQQTAAPDEGLTDREKQVLALLKQHLDSKSAMFEKFRRQVEVSREDVDRRRKEIAAREAENLAETRRLQEIAAQQAIEDENRRREAAELRAKIREIEIDARTRNDIDEASFWFRRFFTTLAISNGGAFVALASGFLQAEQRVGLSKLVVDPMRAFAVGMIAAGLVPVFLWARMKGKANAVDRGRRISGSVSAAATGIALALTVASAIALAIGASEAITAIGAVK